MTSLFMAIRRRCRADSRCLRGLLVLGLVCWLARPARAFTAQSLWNAWPSERFVATSAACIRPARLEREIAALAARFPERVAIEEIGESVQGRSIRLLTLGTGPRKVLLWSQMHGDEPSATPALLDLTRYLLTHPEDPDTALVLSELTLLMVPMLNPDGAEVYTRRNAQGIDMNRDALNLTTPEGRLLKRLRDRHEPFLGFNLHDQNRRRTVGNTKTLATNAVLAVTGDEAATVTEGRLRAKRAGAAIAAALEPFAPGGLARYDEEWSPRAFGDNLTAWGTPVVLIESGGLPPGRSLAELTRLNFVALLVTLRDLARNDLADHDPEDYQRIPENNVDVWADVVVRGGEIRQPGSPRPYRADLAWNVPRPDRVTENCDGAAPGAVVPAGNSEIIELGDARFFGAGREVDATGKVLLAPFTVGIDGWAARRWLDGPALDRLSRHGVARLLWTVEARDLGAALNHAESLRGPGRAPLEPMMGKLPEGLPILRRPLAAPRTGATLGERLRALVAAGGGEKSGNIAGQGRVNAAPAGAPLDHWLAAVWAANSPERAALRPDAPASFLLVRKNNEAGAEVAPLEGGTVEAVWIDGVEVR